MYIKEKNCCFSNIQSMVLFNEVGGKIEDSRPIGISSPTCVLDVFVLDVFVFICCSCGCENIFSRLTRRTEFERFFVSKIQEIVPGKSWTWGNAQNPTIELPKQQHIRLDVWVFETANVALTKVLSELELRPIQNAPWTPALNLMGWDIYFLYHFPFQRLRLWPCLRAHPVMIANSKISSQLNFSSNKFKSNMLRMMLNTSSLKSD